MSRRLALPLVSLLRATRASASCGLLGLVAHAVVAPGCSDTASSTEAAGQHSTGTSGSSPGTAPTAPPSFDELTCPTDLPGPTLVRLTTPKGVPYCMDRTEVKQVDFSKFVAATQEKPALLHPQDEPAHCAKGFKLLPDAPASEDDVFFTCSASRYNPDKFPDAPQVCVSPCAARAYCLWAGKDACGSTTRKPLALGDRTNPEASAWHNACTNGGKTEVTVPGGFAAGICRLPVPPVGEPASVDATPKCVGPEAQFDQLLGIGDGVQEWADYVDGGLFYSRGPYPVTTDPGVADGCVEIRGAGGGGPNDWVGFRCCLPLTDG